MNPTIKETLEKRLSKTATSLVLDYAPAEVASALADACLEYANKSTTFGSPMFRKWEKYSRELNRSARRLREIRDIQ